MGWADRVWALPFMSVLCPSQRYAAESPRRVPDTFRTAYWVVADSSFDDAVACRVCVLQPRRGRRIPKALFVSPQHHLESRRRQKSTMWYRRAEYLSTPLRLKRCCRPRSLSPRQMLTLFSAGRSKPPLNKPVPIWARKRNASGMTRAIAHHAGLLALFSLVTLVAHRIRALGVRKQIFFQLPSKTTW